MKAAKKRAIVLVILAAVLLAAWLFYARPVTILQLHPMLSPEQCTEIRGDYVIGNHGRSEFTIDRDSEEFQALWELFFERNYSRSLRDLLPRGTRTHMAQPEEFQWEVYFCFDDVVFPDGSRGSGAMLHFRNWYGELDIVFDGEAHAYRTGGQEAWAADVLAVIQ